MMSAIDALIERLHEYAQGGTDKASLDFSTSPQDAQDVGDELLALKSIYGDDSVVPLVRRQGHVVTAVGETAGDAAEANDAQLQKLEVARVWSPTAPVQVSVTIGLDVASSPDHEDVDETEPPSVRLLVILPAGYPSGKDHPTAQLLSKYIGMHSTDHILFGQMTRIFRRADLEAGNEAATLNSSEHVDFVPGQVALFDGIDKARELAEQWYSQREAIRLQRVEEQRPIDEVRRQTHDEQAGKDASVFSMLGAEKVQQSGSANSGRHTESLHLVSAPAIVDRKSTFVGHAAFITHPDQVPLALSQLLESDRRIARATHPTMHAWICRTDDGVVHRDCDDDGETAAGGRLAHLLDLLHLDNVLVVVSRWYGGVHLGPDRFKLINRAARDALELLGAIDGPLNRGADTPTSSRARTKNKR